MTGSDPGPGPHRASQRLGRTPYLERGPTGHEDQAPEHHAAEPADHAAEPADHAAELAELADHAAELAELAEHDEHDESPARLAFAGRL